MRKDQQRVSVKIDDRQTGVWDVMTGGDTDSDQVQYRPGGMAPVISLGGSITPGAAVISRNYTLERDQAIIHWLLERVGKAQVEITKNVLDPDGNIYGKPLVMRGTLKRVAPPEVDSNATGEAAMLEIEVAFQGVIT